MLHNPSAVYPRLCAATPRPREFNDNAGIKRVHARRPLFHPPTPIFVRDTRRVSPEKLARAVNGARVISRAIFPDIPEQKCRKGDIETAPWYRSDVAEVPVHLRC